MNYPLDISMKVRLKDIQRSVFLEKNLLQLIDFYNLINLKL